MKKTLESKLELVDELPALSRNERENQMINYAECLAEKQLREGTASSAVIVHYLKLGTEKEALERERLRKENDLISAKSESLKSQKRTEELFANALKHLKEYRGDNENSEEDY